MELKDLLTFAKAGYTPSQVKELLAIKTEEPEPKEVEDELQEPKEELQEPKEELQEPKTETIIKETEKEIDYKALYEESQKQLQIAQSKNLTQNVQPEVINNEKIVTDLISGLL